MLPWYIAQGLTVFMISLASNAVYFFAGYVLHQSVQVRLGMSASAGLVYCVAALFGGRLVDRFGQRHVGSIAAFACLLVFIFGSAAVFFQSMPALFLFLPLLNLCVGPLWPAVESAITRCPGTMRLSLRMTLYNLNWSIMGFIAACIAGAMAQWLSWPVVFLVAAAISLLVWIILRMISSPQSAVNSPPAAALPRQREEDGRGRVNSIRAQKLLHIAWLSNMLAFVAANTVTPFMPSITLALGVKSYALATALASIASLACVGGFLVMTFWTGWHYRIRWTMIPFAVLAVGAVSMLFSQSIMMFICSQILYGFAVAMLYSGSIYYSMHLGAGSAAKAGIHEALIGVGAALGPGLVAGAGAPNAVAPKGLALLVVLCIGGGVMSYWTWQTCNLRATDHRLS